MDRIYNFDSPLGPLTAASDGSSLTGLWFRGQAHFGRTLGPEREERFLPVFRECAAWLGMYFGGAVPDFTPPLNLRGTPFQKAVWDLLTKIPPGETVTYGELARTLRPEGGGMAARAAGSAVGLNPVSLIVPCHRVVGADGSLPGYAGGVGRKLRLLELERGMLC